MAGQYGFLIDMRRCNGCRTCSMACKSENATPPGVLWRRVRQFTPDDPNDIAFISMSCNHCDEPQCLKACPAHTYVKRPDGIVAQEHHEFCVGCRMCVMACPYNAPVFDRAEGKTGKCDLCAARIDEGLKPRCAEACPSGALRFGEIAELRKGREDETSLIARRCRLPDPSHSKPNIVILPAWPHS